MNFQFYIEKLLDSQEFQQFKKEHPSAFLCSGFFSIDKKTQEGKNIKADNQQHLDYYIPELNKMFSFKLNQNPIEVMPVENFGFPEGENKIQKISDNIDFNFEELENKIVKKMEEEKINKKIEKILWSLQNSSEKKGTFLLGTVFISNLGMIKLSYNLEKKEITDFEKKSFFDFLKIMKKDKK